MAKHGDKIDFDILAEMDELHFCIKEALRMHPPLIMLLRQCNVPFEVETTKGKKFVVPKGHIVATSPAFAHRMDEVYSEPNVYKPERFKGESPEDKRAYASFIGFGSGRHGCMGETFAYMQIKTIWSHLLRNFDFELVGKLPEPDYGDGRRPQAPVHRAVQAPQTVRGDTVNTPSRPAVSCFHIYNL